MNPPNEPTAYLSDDAESRMRVLAPVQCRLCRHLVARQSFLLDKPEIRCGKPEGEDENAKILGVLLIRLAKRGECDFCLPFQGLI